MDLGVLRWRVGAVTAFGLAGCWAFGQSGLTQLTVQVDKPGVKISPKFYGLMTEEINHAYDGGLYGELIQNRSFRDSSTGTPHWSVYPNGNSSGAIKLDFDAAKGPLGTSLQVDVISADKANQFCVVNDGYWGIPVKPNTTYRGSFYAKSATRGAGEISISLAGNSTLLAKATVGAPSGDWKKFNFTLKSGNTSALLDSKFVLGFSHAGTILLRDVSLFGPTFNKRPNGNRIDLMQMLGEMKPSFLRLPGGNYLEGDTIPDRFDWKSTIGDTSTRPGHQGPWGYRSSDGLGLLEFLVWCEDLHMEPLLAVYAGYSLRQQHVAPGRLLTPYVQDALDEIEYLTGGTDTKWGARRAQDGHEKPLPLTYVEIGNEDQFDRSGSYDGRYAQFYDAIKSKYPKLKLIATMPVKSRTPDVVDDHYYRSAAEMARDSGHYDGYSRKGPKIFVGEWASIGGNPTPTYREALGDAAWLTGLERNSDLVVMEAYAPLLVNVNPRGSQWPTNLIGYDGLTSFGSPSYYVQSMFAKATGTTVLPVGIKLADLPLAPMPAPHGAIGLGTYVTNSEYKDIQVTAEGKTVYQKNFKDGMADWKRLSGNWSAVDGALRQIGNGRDTHITAGESNWTDYTYHVKAKKISGTEGFMVLFHVQNDQTYLQWNVGGWQNTRSAIQRHDEGAIDELGQATDTTVQTGRWYDIRVELHGTDIKCYLDDKLITEVSEAPRPQVSPLYAAASSVGSKGDVFLKVVNVSGQPIKTELNLEGVKSITSAPSGWILTGSPSDANTVKEPTKVAPKAITVNSGTPSFVHEFPAYSITVLRFKVKR